VFALSVLVFPLYCVQLTAAPAGAVYYVDGVTGNDFNGGTAGAPWRTIQKAANTLVAGETAIVNAGTYYERVLVTRSGTAGNLITFQALGNVLMQGFNIQASYIKVDGFEIANIPAVDYTNRSNGSGVYLLGSNSEITNNYIHQTPAAGIYLEPSGTSNNLIGANRIVSAVECGIFAQGNNNLVVSNDISHTRAVAGSDADGIRFFGTGSTIRKNYIHDIVAADSPGQILNIDAIQTWGPADSVTIEQNMFDVPGDNMQGAMISISVAPVQNLTFRNNIFINGSQTPPGPAINIMGYSGTGLLNTVFNTIIANNTFVRTGGNNLAYCVNLHDGVQNATVMNNVFYNCGGSLFGYVSTAPLFGGTTSGITIGNNSVFTTNGVPPLGGANPSDVWMVDPMFVNTATRDFHPQAASPLINTGATLPQATNDYDGVARPQGTAPDIGAFEFSSSSTGSLAKSNTMTRNSANFDPNNAVGHLWDGCLSGSATCTAGGMGIGSFWIEFDFGGLQNLTSARLFGDADGTWWSYSWTLQYKSNATDAWSTAFSNVNALFDAWSTQSLSVTARYVRVEVFGNPATRDTEARELEIYGTPAQPANRPPTVNAGPDQTITLPASANLNGTASDDGMPAGSTMTTTWSKVSGPGTVTFGNVNAKSTTASFSTAGTYVLRLTASDGQLSSTDDVSIVVNPANQPPPNQPPTVNAGPDQTITLPASANLNGTASDDGLPAGSTLTTTWSKVSGPGTVTFGNVNARSTTASFSTAGTYVLRLSGSDGQLSSSDDVAIAVNPASGGGPASYVDASTGNDSNPGTSSAPWRTIQKAANTVNAGATVNVRAGTYNERVTVSRSGSAGSLMTFQAQGTVVMNGFSISGSYVRVDGFEIANVAASGVNPSAYAGIFTSGDFNEARNNYIHDMGAWGVYLDTAASNNTIMNNRIFRPGHCGMWVHGTGHLIEGNDISRSQQHPPNWTSQPSWVDADGIVIEGSGHTFRKNTIHDIYPGDPGQTDPHTDCFQIPSVTVSNIIIEQNTCRNLPPGPTGRGTQASMFQGTISNVTIRNNLVRDISRGFNFDGSPGPITGLNIVNNTFVRLSDSGVDFGNSSVANAVVKNNIFQSVRSPYVALGGNSSAGVGNNLSYPASSNFPGDLSATDPRFVSLGGNDFHLQDTSPAINRGANLSVVTNDFDGVARPQGPAYDIGSFEFSNGGGSTPPPTTGSLANSTTMVANSGNFDPNNPVTHLWDGCLQGTPSCTAGAFGIPSFWIEFDLGSLYDLTSARLFGDATGQWWSTTWQLQYRQSPSDPWSTAFSGVNAFMNDWSTQSLTVTARYVRVEVFGNPNGPATEARELEIYGTLR